LAKANVCQGWAPYRLRNMKLHRFRLRPRWRQYLWTRSYCFAIKWLFPCCWSR